MDTSTPTVPAIPPKLSRFQQRVVELVLEGYPAVGIAEITGKPVVQVMIALQDPEVRAAYAKARMNLDAALSGDTGVQFKTEVMDRADRITVLTHIATSPGEKTADRLAAIAQLSKIAGDVIDRSEVNLSGQVDLRSLVLDITARENAARAAAMRQAQPPPVDTPPGLCDTSQAEPPDDHQSAPPPDDHQSAPPPDDHQSDIDDLLGGL